MATIDRYWFIKDGEIAIVQYDSTGTTVNGVTSRYISSSAGGTVKVHYVGRPEAMDGDAGDTSPIPATFHKYLVAKVIAEGYKDPRNIDLNNAQFFDAEFEKGVVRGRKEGRREYKATGRIVPGDF